MPRTGFTDQQLVARCYLFEAELSLKSDSVLKWAVFAGHSEAKLPVAKMLILKEKPPHVKLALVYRIPIIVAEAEIADAILALTMPTKAVLASADLHAVYTNLLAQLYAERGVHCCDLMGEMTKVDKHARKYEAVANKSG